MNGVTWAERPEHPRAKVIVPRPQTDPFVPSWAGRTILGIATVAAFVVIGSPLGAGLTVVLLALGAVAAAVRRPGGAPDGRPAQASRARRVLTPGASSGGRWPPAWC